MRARRSKRPFASPTSPRCAGACRSSTPTCSASTRGRTAPPYEQLLVDMGPGNVRERMRVVRQLVWKTVRDIPGAVLVSASATKVVYKALLSSARTR